MQVLNGGPWGSRTYLSSLRPRPRDYGEQRGVSMVSCRGLCRLPFLPSCSSETAAVLVGPRRRPRYVRESRRLTGKK